MNRALEPGEIGISLMLTGVHEIVRETDYYLVDRSMQPGDIVKRSVHDVQSGVILESKVEVKLEHAVSMAQYAGWVWSDELENATEVYIGDYVLYDDWVGQIEEVRSPFCVLLSLCLTSRSREQIFDEAIAGESGHT